MMNKAEQEEISDDEIFSYVFNLKETDLNFSFSLNKYETNEQTKVQSGERVLNISVMTRNCNWIFLTDEEKRDFMIEKWTSFFTAVPGEYSTVVPSEIIQTLKDFTNIESKSCPSFFVRKQIFRRNNHMIIADISHDRAELAWVKDSD
ncbi:hypothetical protein [Chryseobacterium herbae]|uniref:Uncharacterized protein n=1 Tax=Chryseobacterium herbae TaxID=2976476 RepID=A0ABT2IRM3_9FLAO|nr:hypothetical protein [Chryseobacterium sp. pc1-10]MCT2561481.1 hypothetical protein [Chryseobacterium sp. pc1-10]